MKREILFRGRAIKGTFDGWFFGMISICEDTGLHKIRYQVSNRSFLEVSVHPESVGQLLHRDKNMILFEGDIVKLSFHKEVYNKDTYSGYRVGEVLLSKRNGVCIKKGYYWDEGEDEFFHCRIEKTISFCRSEIIGNVFDNPELLKIPKT